MGKKQSIFTISALSAAMLLTGCLGGSGGDDTVSTSSTVSLSGVVQQTSGGSLSGKPLGKAAVGGAGAGVFSAAITDATAFDALVSSPLGGALVLVTDAQGNTLSGIANADGTFSIPGLDKGGSYAVIFIDTRTLQILGSLVQATDPTKPGEFTMAADTTLGDILIDPVNKRAVAEADVKETVVVADATATMDKDGDGIITQDDVNEMQAETLVAEAAIPTPGDAPVKTLQKVSIMSFMGDANTWGIAKEAMGGGGGGGGHWQTDPNTQEVVMYEEGDERREMNLRRNISVAGPKGDTITAIKDASITYYGGQIETRYAAGTDLNQNPGATPISGPTPVDGYFNYDAASTGSPWGASWSEFWVDGNNDAIRGWANYRYLDAVENQIYEGEMEDGKISWRTMLPNNVALGVPQVMDFDETWTQTHFDPSAANGTGADVVYQTSVDANMTVTIDKVDGAVITDLLGKKLPVMRVDFEQDINVTVTVDGVIDDQMSAQHGDKGKGAFFIVAKYGVEGPAYDCSALTSPPANNDMTTCAPVTWDVALADARFGIVSPSDVKTAPATSAKVDVDAADLGAAWNQTDGHCNPTGLTSIPANTVCDVTPADLVAGTGTATTMPSYDMDDLINTGATYTTATNLAPVSAAADLLTVRNSWLSAMSEFMDKIDRRDDGDGQRSWFYIEGNEFGPKIEPVSWNPDTGMAYALTAGSPVTIETDKTGTAGILGASLPDGDSSFRYGLHSGSTVTTYMVAGLKQYDPEAQCRDDRGNTWLGCDKDVVNGAATAHIELVDPGNSSGQQALYFTMTPPEVNTTNYKDVWMHWEETSANVWEPYCASHVSVWFSMVEAATQNAADPATIGTDGGDQVIESHPVNFYMVKAATAAVSQVDMQGGAFPDVKTHCAAPAL